MINYFNSSFTWYKAETPKNSKQKLKHLKMADYKDVVEMFGNNLASLLELAKKWLTWKIDFIKLLHSLHQIKKIDLLGLVEGTHQITTISIPIKAKASAFDSTIYVDRFIDVGEKLKAINFDHFLEVDLENKGPDKYDLSEIELFVHPEQVEKFYCDGTDLYSFLLESGKIENCLSLQDGLAITQKGIFLFKKFFEGNKLFLWKSAIMDSHGLMFVPYASAGTDNIGIGWLQVHTNYKSDMTTAILNKK
jgi:hypothetical protein